MSALTDAIELANASTKNERARCLAVLDDMIAAAEARRKGHHATPWLKHARDAVASGIDPRELEDGVLHADNAEPA